MQAQQQQQQSPSAEQSKTQEASQEPLPNSQESSPENVPASYQENIPRDYEVIENTFIYNGASDDEQTNEPLPTGSTVTVLKVEPPFAKVQGIFSNGETRTFWLPSKVLEPVR